MITLSFLEIRRLKMKTLIGLMLLWFSVSALAEEPTYRIEQTSDGPKVVTVDFQQKVLDEMKAWRLQEDRQWRVNQWRLVNQDMRRNSPVIPPTVLFTPYEPIRMKTTTCAPDAWGWLHCQTW